MRIDPQAIESAAKELYIRALKILPDDVKQGFDALAARETSATAKEVLGTMIRNIAVAEATDNLLCQDTGIPIYNVTVGRGVEFGAADGVALKAAIRRGCERATREHPLRSAIRPLGTHCADPAGAALEDELSAAVNLLGVGPQGLGGDSTAFAVHVELAATHITMNPVAVNMQCHSARRASATITPDGVRYGF